jgi:hypothetical protein
MQASNEEALRIVRSDIDRAQLQGQSYDRFRAEYRPTGGDRSLRQLWDEQRQQRRRQQQQADVLSPDTRAHRLSDAHTLEMLRQLDAAAASKA